MEASSLPTRWDDPRLTKAVPPGYGEPCPACGCRTWLADGRCVRCAAENFATASGFPLDVDRAMLAVAREGERRDREAGRLTAGK